MVRVVKQRREDFFYSIPSAVIGTGKLLLLPLPLTVIKSPTRSQFWRTEETESFHHHQFPISSSRKQRRSFKRSPGNKFEEAEGSFLCRGSGWYIAAAASGSPPPLGGYLLDFSGKAIYLFPPPLYISISMRRWRPLRNSPHNTRCG